MSDSKAVRDVELLGRALDDEPLTDDDARDAVRRLGFDTKGWAANVRKRVAAASEAERKERFERHQLAYESDLARLNATRPEPARSLADQRAEVQRLIAWAPREMAASVHAHKFEQATEDELAEMIRSLRFLLGEKDEEP
jgi:hypothetical protein